MCISWSSTRASNTQAYFASAISAVTTMRELTGKELDTVCGGLFDFTTGARSPIIKQIMISQINKAWVRQTGLVNTSLVRQLNVAIATIL